MQLVNIGFGNVVSANKIVSIVSPEAAPIKRLVQEAKDAKRAINATCGRRTRAVLIMDSGACYIYLQYNQKQCSKIR